MTDDAGDDFYSLNATDDWRVAEEDVYYDDAYGIQDDVQDDDLNLVAETMTWLDHLLVNANANVTNATQLSPAEDVNPDALLATLAISSAACVALLTAYGCLRRALPSLYSRRRGHGHTAPGAPAAAGAAGGGGADAPPDDWDKAPLARLLAVHRTPWPALRRRAGLDAYFFLRYIRLCLKITAVSSFWALLLLCPVYATGDGGETGLYFLSMANVPQKDKGRAWFAAVFCWAFTLYCCFCIRDETFHYVELRMEFLGAEEDVEGEEEEEEEASRGGAAGGEGPSPADADGGYPAAAPLLTPRAHHVAPRTKQHRFSLQVEKIPAQLRSNAALFAYFDAMFPGKVHSARVAMNVPDLDTLSARRVRVCRRLEKSLAYFEATGRRPVHVAGRPRCRCCGIESITISLPGEVKDVDDTSEAHEAYESLPEKGEVVDSIQYYTLELAICNQRLHEMQKEKFLIAETGRTPRVSGPDNEDDAACVWYSDPLGKIKSSAAAAAEGLREGFEVSGEEDYLGDGPAGGTLVGGYGAVSRGASPNGAATLAGTEAREARLNLVDEDHLVEADEAVRRAGGEGDGRGDAEDAGGGGDDDDDDDDEARERERRRRRRRPHLRLRACLWRMGVDFLAAGLDEVRRNTDVVVDSVTRPSMSSTGFVTFRTLMPVTVTTSSPLTYNKDPMEVKVAPEPRDLVWQNVPIDKDIGSSRAFFANTLLGLGVLLWSIPLTLIQAWAKIENVALIPGLEWVAKIQSVELKQFINGYLPVVALLGLILLLPLIFQWVATSYEKRKTFSGVQSSIIGRYFYYQLANIYITVTAGALWTSAADIINNPQKLLVILGQTFPKLAGYFISLLITKTLVGLPTTLLRVGALSRLIFLRGCFREKWLTERELKEVVFRKLPLQYGWEYPTLFLVIIICFNYACITPVVLPAGAVYFFIALLVYKKQAMHVYTPTYESGGKMFPQAVTKTLLALFTSQLTFIGYSLIRKNVFQIILLAPLPFMTIFFMQFVQHRYFDPSKKLSLERAIQISYSQEFSDDMFSAEAYQQPVLTEKAAIPMCSLCEPGVEK